MMSKKSSKRKIAPPNVADWVEPSFSDFSKNTNTSFTILHEKTSADTKHGRKIKEHFSLLDSCKNEKKKRKQLSTDERCKPPKQHYGQIETWVDKYKPQIQDELAVHKKKIEEVEAWLKGHIFQRQSKQGGSILLLTGPPGCGKSATVEILAKDLGFQVQEWTTPMSLDFTKDGFHSTLNHDFQAYQSQTALFQEFLFTAKKYPWLRMVGESLRTERKLILVEDMPNQLCRDPGSLHKILRKFVQTGKHPLVFIISGSFSGASNQRSLFPREVQEELCISNISFNPVAPTIMMKVLNRITAIENSKSTEKNDIPDKAALELICKGCSGDIRSAINSLQFSSLKEYSSENIIWSQRKGNSTLKCDTLSKVKKKKKSVNPLEIQEFQAIGGKDASIFLFHALGKILYCKREPTTEPDIPQLPSHLSEYERNHLLVEPEDVIEKSHMPGDLFNLYLHQNYVDFFSDIDDLVRASEYLSTADFMCSNWDARPTLQAYSASVATRGVMHSNRARAFAQNKGMGFRPLHKPQWFLINKKYQENCLVAKSLFASFCSSPLCLQTELLPYLALLTNPMRNQAQITFIQDVGRLPLQKHFGRLQLESLTDKDSTIQVLGNDDEGEFAESQPRNLLLQMEKTKISENDVRESPLLASGPELPSSQPQPIAAQAAMEEDDLNIEEYDSD